MSGHAYQPPPDQSCKCHLCVRRHGWEGTGYSDWDVEQCAREECGHRRCDRCSIRVVEEPDEVVMDRVEEGEVEEDEANENEDGTDEDEGYRSESDGEEPSNSSTNGRAS